MFKIRTLLVKFKTELSLREIPYFRGVVLNMPKVKDTLYHNHLETGFRYSYPLVQYKRLCGKAAILFLGEGIDAVSELFQCNDKAIVLGNRSAVMELEDIEANIMNVQLWKDRFCYAIRKYLPLNQRNYEQYTHADGTIERLQIIERSLVGNILSFAKGIGLHLDDKVEVKTTGISEPHIYIYKGVKMTGFDMEFKTNISLPNYIGLGKGASLGFGMISR